MSVYSVYAPAPEPADLEKRADSLAFVKEGFSWVAFLVPVLWLIYYRMWIELIVLLVVFGVLQWAFGLDGRAEQLLGWASLAISLLFAFEANDLRTFALERRGYRLAGAAIGKDRAEAELAFFRDWLPQQTKPARAIERVPERSREGQTPAPQAGGDGEEVIGLFPRS